MSSPGADTLLSSTDLGMRFSGFDALAGVDIAVRRGQILGLIGPNGSGKSTWINCVSGVYRPTSGKVTFRGRDVTGRPPHQLYRARLGRTFQDLQNFPQMPVMENMLLAGQEGRGSMTSRLFKQAEHAARQKAAALLDFIGIADSLWLTPMKSLSYGQQKLCDLAMTLMADPELILLDEPMAGVNPALIEQLVDRIEALNRMGTTFVIIEHNLKVTMRLCHWLVVLDHGVKLAEGLPEQIQANEQVLEAYFGSYAPDQTMDTSR